MSSWAQVGADPLRPLSCLEGRKRAFLEGGPPSRAAVGPELQAFCLSAHHRKRALEVELDACRAKLCAVEAQLLEVLQEKLRLSQEVEAWEVGWADHLGLGWGTWVRPLNLLSCPQEDMQRMVQQQVERQLQREAGVSLRAPLDRGAPRAPWGQFPLGWRGFWR